MKKFEANIMDFIFDAVFNGAINLAIELLVTHRYLITSSEAVGKDKTVKACKHSSIPRKNCFVSRSVCKQRNSCPSRKAETPGADSQV